MTATPTPGGTGLVGDRQVARVGYGAMAVEHIPTADEAAALLRRAIALGINHIDTASFYGGGEVNRRIRRALAPYPEHLLVVSKVGARHVSGGRVPLALAQKPAELRAAVELDLAELGLDQIAVVN